MRRTSLLLVPIALVATIVVVAPPAFATPTVIIGVIYKSTPQYSLALDIYLPPGPGPFPAVVAVHGGGFSTPGSRSGQIATDAANLAGEGFVVYVPDYRASCNRKRPPPGYDPTWCGYKSPASADDIRSAVQWVRDNAATYQTDGARVGLLGVSTGGNLANLAGILGTPGQDRGDVVVSWSGDGDLTATPNASSRKYIGCDFSVCPDKWHAASPTSVVTVDSAPLYLSGSEFDTLVPFSVEQAEIQRYNDLGVQNQWHMLYGVQCHARTCVNKYPVIWTESVAWLHQWLGY